MMQTTTWASDNAGVRRVVTTWQTVAAQPGWVRRIALLTFLLIVMLPILFLLLIAIGAALVVFAALAMANAVSLRVRSLFGRGGYPSTGGRENVRVIERVD